MANGLDAQKNALKALETDVTTTYPQALEQLEQRLDAAFAAAENTIKELEAHATQMTDTFIAAVHELRDAVDHGRQQTDEHVKTSEAALTDTKGHVDDASKKRDGDFHDLQTTLAQLEQAYNKIESDSKSALDNVVQHAQPLVALVTQGTTAVHEHGEQLSQGLQQTHAGFADELKNMAQSLHDLVQHIESEQHQHDGEQEQHSGSTAEHAAQLIAQNLDTLTHGMQGIGSAFGLLGEFGNTFGEHFGDGVKDLMSVLEEIGKIVDAIKPVLEVIKAIE
jgi:septal ring factor EnvC (AmiA/AmiB activator)